MGALDWAPLSTSVVLAGVGMLISVVALVLDNALNGSYGDGVALLLISTTLAGAELPNLSAISENLMIRFPLICKLKPPSQP